MTRLRPILWVAALSFAAGGASAGTLSSATWTTELPGFEPTFSAVAVPVIASGSSTSTSVGVSLTLPAFQTSAFGTGGVIATYRSLTLSGAVDLTANGTMVVASMGMPGLFRVKTAYHAGGQNPNASMLTPGALTLLKIPLSIGGGVASTGYFYVSGTQHYFTIDHYDWIVGTQTFTDLTLNNAALPTVVAMGSFGLTTMGGGNVLLVAPTRIAIDGPLSQRRTVSLTTLQLQFVPEPGAALLLGAGGLGILAAKRRR